MVIFLGFEGILVILFGHFWVSRVFWSFFRLRGYFGHFFGFWEYFDNFKVSGVFWSFFRFWGYFGHFLGFRGILVIFWVLGIFWSFLGFEGILVIFEDFRVFGHFHFMGILVILIIGLLGGLGFTHNNWVGLGLS